MDHPTVHLDGMSWHYDPGAAWFNQRLWLPDDASVKILLSYERKAGWHGSRAVALLPTVDGSFERDERNYTLGGTITTDPASALFRTLYTAADEWAEPRLFP